MKRRSIGERLAKAQTLEQSRDIALEWATSWQADHDEVIRHMERMIG